MILYPYTLGNKKTSWFPQLLIFLIIITDSNFNFLLLYDFNEISIIGFFKPADLAITILVLYYFIFDYKFDSTETYFNKNNIIYIIFFVIFYIFYTIIIAQTSNLLEAFRTGRHTLYIFLFFIFKYYISSEKVFYRFFYFIKLSLYISVISFFLELFGIHVLYQHWKEQWMIIPRIYFVHTTFVLFIFGLGIIQKIISYKGRYKINNIDIVFCIIFFLTSLSRTLWASALFVAAVIQIIGFLKIYEKIQFKRQILSFGILFIIIIIVISFTLDLGLKELLFDRLLNAQEDIKYGEGTLAFRLKELGIWLSISENKGLIYTGLGFVHGYSDFVQNSPFILSSNKAWGTWGTELGFGFALIYWGYIGTVIFHLIIFKMTFGIMGIIKILRNNIAFSFGLSISIVILTNFVVYTFFSSAMLNMINIAFLLALFNSSVRLFNHVGKI